MLAPNHLTILKGPSLSRGRSANLKLWPMYRYVRSQSNPLLLYQFRLIADLVALESTSKNGGSQKPCIWTALRLAQMPILSPLVRGAWIETFMASSL